MLNKHKYILTEDGQFEKQTNSRFRRQISWVKYSLTSHSTHYRSLQRRSWQPIYWLVQNTQTSQPITWLILTKLNINYNQ